MHTVRIESRILTLAGLCVVLMALVGSLGSVKVSGQSPGPQPPGLDVVLVIDNSQSMADRSDAANLRILLARRLVERLSEIAGTTDLSCRVGIVSFALGARRVVELTDVSDALKERIVAERRAGSDFRQALDEVLTQFRQGSFGTGNRKAVILITEGEPQLTEKPLTPEEMRAYFSTDPTTPPLDSRGKLVDRIRQLEMEGAMLFMVAIGDTERERQNWMGLSPDLTYIRLSGADRVEEVTGKILGHLLGWLTPTVTPETPTPTPTLLPGPVSTLKPGPTATVRPTITAMPTATVRPTITAMPTATVRPTMTIMPATPVPAATPTMSSKSWLGITDPDSNVWAGFGLGFGILLIIVGSLVGLFRVHKTYPIVSSARKLASFRFANNDNERRCLASLNQHIDTTSVLFKKVRDLLQRCTTPSTATAILQIVSVISVLGDRVSGLRDSDAELTSLAEWIAVVFGALWDGEDKKVACELSLRLLDVVLGQSRERAVLHQFVSKMARSLKDRTEAGGMLKVVKFFEDWTREGVSFGRELFEEAVADQDPLGERTVMGLADYGNAGQGWIKLYEFLKKICDNAGNADKIEAIRRNAGEERKELEKGQNVSLWEYVAKGENQGPAGWWPGKIIETLQNCKGSSMSAGC